VQKISAQNISTYSFNELYGFEENTIFSMLQDEEGYMWLGTSNGLYRFNGFGFKHYTYPGYDIEYYNLKMDENGSIWFANFGGQLFYLNKDSLNLVVENSLDNNYIYEYAVLDDNKVYYHTINATNIIETDFLGNQKVAFGFNKQQKITSSFIDNEVFKLFIEEDIDNQRLIKVFNYNYTNQQISLEDSCFIPIASSKKFARKIDDNTYVYLQNHDDLDLVLFSRDEHVKVYNCSINSKNINNYIVVDGELILLGIKESFFLHFKEDNTIQLASLSNIKNASNILKDNEDNLWISSLNKGIFIAPNRVFYNQVISPIEEIKQVIVTEQNDVFYVTDEGKLYQLDNATKTPHLIYDKNFNPNFKIDVNPFKNELLIPGSKWYFKIDSKEWEYKEESNFYKDIHFLDANNAIFTLNSTDLISFDKQYEKLNYQFKIQDTIEDINNYILTKIADGRANIIAEESNQEHLYVNQINGVIHYTKDKVDTLLYNGNPVLASAFKSSENALWLADIAGNIHQIKQGEIVQSFHLGIRIEHIVVKDSLVFLQSKQSIYKFNYFNKEILNIDYTDGLIKENIANLSTTDSSLLVWGTNTLQEIPFSYNYTNKIPPKINIEEILVNDKAVDFSSNNILEHNENNIEFYFRSISIRSQKKRNYFYRIKELSDTWEITNFEVPYVRYSQLAPGNYTFQVKVQNEDGIFSKTIDLPFKIDKHFTKKWWFILSIIALVSLLVYLIVSFRIKILNKQALLKQEKEILQKDVYKAKISAIRAQMNPHFIFNALNSIQTLVLRGDIDNTYTYINKFAGLIRQTLSFSAMEFVPIDDEISLLETYLNLEKLRFRNDFDYEIIQNELPAILVPPMLIQPFVENALKHGLLHLPTNRKIKLTFYFNEVLICEVEDNGIGRKASAEINKRRNRSHQSFAISALQQRFVILQEKFDYKIGFTYFDLEENGVAKGTKVIIRIPFKNYHS